MRLKMEPSGNGKTPKTPVGTGAAQQNGAGSSAAPTAGSNRQQNGQSTTTSSSSSTATSSKRSTTKGTSSTTNVGGGGIQTSSTTSSSLPTIGASSTSTGSSSSSSTWPQFRFATTLPLRILVLKDLVGAIIGRGGGTIRQITQDTHARVDVHRKESSTSHENVIMIYGNPDNCSQACRRILEVMQQEAKSLNRPDEISLKILASNNLIGRIIGKGGNTIKRIMQQTSTKITINSANIASQYQLERIISISGQLENMCKAEVMISQKLRQCFESDYMQYQQSLMYTGFHSSIPPLLPPGQTGPIGMSGGYVGPAHAQQPGPPPMSYPLGASPTCTNLPPSALVGRTPAGVLAAAAAATGSSVSSPTSSATGAPSSQTHSVPPTPTQGPTAAFYSPYNLAFMYPPPHSPASSAGNIGAAFSSGPSSAPYMNINYLSPMLPNVDNVKETVTIYIPNSVVGAIIGRGGSTIREMMSNSGATIKVAQMNEEESNSSSGTNESTSTTSTGATTANKTLERRVTIYGNAFSQSHAQYFVFQKVFAELSNQLSANPATICPYNDPSILKVEIMVPTSQVKRIIGKGGSVISDLQRTSGATIKLSKESTTSTTATSSPSATTATASSSSTSTFKPVSPSTSTAEQQSPTSPNGAGSEDDVSKTDKQKPSPTIDQQQQDMTSVFILGDFSSSFNAQRQIRLIVHRSMPTTSTSAAATTSSSVPSSSSKATMATKTSCPPETTTPPESSSETTQESTGTTTTTSSDNGSSSSATLTTASCASTTTTTTTTTKSGSNTASDTAASSTTSTTTNTGAVSKS